MKKILFLFIISIFPLFAGEPPAERAVGLFFSVGLGPRFPISNFSNSTDLGYGINVELSYTDNEILPFFLYLKSGFEQYPGSQKFYQVTSYSNYSINSIPISLGARYYFKPLMENILLFIPMAEASVNVNNSSILHQFKESSNRSNYTANMTKVGFSAGIGFSTFLIELMGSYNYYQSNEYVSMDLKIRLPLYIIY
jgi:hypothetical protein